MYSFDSESHRYTERVQVRRGFPVLVLSLSLLRRRKFRSGSLKGTHFVFFINLINRYPSIILLYLSIFCLCHF